MPPHGNLPASAAPIALPPLELMKIVGSVSVESYVSSGRNLFRMLKQFGGLKQSDRVLDVGCGCGRLAFHLKEYLVSGSYDGFDVVPELIDWRRDHITPQHPNFRFEQVDVSNRFYHDRGKGRAAQYRFPYPADTFDFSVLTSVFTHMLREEFENYAGEVARTLKPGGTALMTFFLDNEGIAPPEGADAERLPAVEALRGRRHSGARRQAAGSRRLLSRAPCAIRAARQRPAGSADPLRLLVRASARRLGPGHRHRAPGPFRKQAGADDGGLAQRVKRWVIRS